MDDFLLAFCLLDRTITESVKLVRLLLILPEEQSVSAVSTVHPTFHDLT